jgi:hypothetical protein
MRTLPLLIGSLLLAGASTASYASCTHLDSGKVRPSSMPSLSTTCGGPGEAGGGTVTVEGVGSALTTLFGADNSFAGNTFDLVATVPMQITSFDVNLDTPGSVETIAIYWRNGTANGAQDNPAGWNLMGTATVTSAGANNPTPVAIGGLNLIPGQTYGIYVDFQSYPTSAASLLYTNGGPTTFSNGDLSLTTYHGKGDPAFTGPSFFPRQWNGTVYYTAVNDAVPAPAMNPMGMILLGLALGMVGFVALRRAA